MKTHRVFPPAVVAVIAIVTAAFNQRTISDLERENLQIRKITNEAVSSDFEADRNRASSNLVEQLRGETRDLYKLRAEVQQLRELRKDAASFRENGAILHQLASQHDKPTTGHSPVVPFVPASELRLTGNSAPEAAVQSLLCAMREGQLDKIAALMAPLPRPGDAYPNYITRPISSFYGGDNWTDEDKALELKAFATALNSFRIVDQKMVSPDKIELTLDMTAADDHGNVRDVLNVNIEATLINSQWKIGPGRAAR